MVVHLTSVPRRGGPYDWEVELPRGAAGLPFTSIATCAEVYTLFKDNLSELAGTLGHEHVERIDRALSVALALRFAV
ncbi:type II toxin-antitoxin system PemK/MazF family toxin [Myxococcota bacterium]